MSVIRFHVLGEPKPKGSMRAFVRGGKVAITNDCVTAKPWAERVHWAARDAAGRGLFFGAVHVTLEFVMPRPGRLGKKRIGVPSTTRPDIDKLVRNVLDALTGVLFVDDAQVAVIHASKIYADFGEPPGVTITVEEVAP